MNHKMETVRAKKDKARESISGHMVPSALFFWAGQEHFEVGKVV